MARTMGHHHSHDHHHDHNHSGHSHGHSHGHMGHNHGQSLGWLTALSAFYMVTELVTGWLSGSLSLIADSGHMAVDVAAMGISLFALWMAKKPPTLEKTYGYYRAEILAALVNGAALVAMSVAIFIEAITRLRTPHEIKGSMMMAVAIGGLAINLFGLWMIRRASKTNLSMRSVSLHLLSDTLGSVAALVASICVLLWNWTLADSIASMGISVLILVGSWKLLSEVVNVLLEGVPRGLNVKAIELTMKQVAGVVEVHDLHVWTVTSGVPALSAHVKIGEKSKYDEILDGLICTLKEKFQIDHVTLQLEPHTFQHPSDKSCSL